MKKIHTHYDELKVARDAPVSVVRAAYKALSQENHPDRSAHPDATVIMARLNVAYAVLSDAACRRLYNQQLADEESAEASRPEPDLDINDAQAKPEPTEATLSDLHKLNKSNERLWVYGLAVVACLVWAGMIASIVGKKQDLSNNASLIPNRIEPSTDPKAGEPKTSEQKFILQVVTLSSQEKAAEVQVKLREMGISSYTQKTSTASGEMIRVRVGPISREETDKVRVKLGRLGLAGTVTPA